MKIVLVDQGSVGASVALRAAELGHEVHWYIQPKKDNFAEQTGKGLHKNIKKITEWIPAAASADLIISTENGEFLQKLKFFRDRGQPVWAPSQACADLEIKRGLGLKFFEENDLPVPEYKTFKNLAEAEKFVFKNPEAYAFKTLGDNDDKSLTYVSKSPAQMIQQLRTWQKCGMNPKGQVMLQKVVEGTEFAVSAWVGQEGFCGPFMHCWEHKKLMNDEKGPNTGEMGSVVQYVRDSKLGEMLLRPIEDKLVEMESLCNFDLNCIIDEKGNPFILESTCRFGWPTFNIQMGLFEGDWCEMLYDACKGTDSFEVSTDFGIGVVLAIPDFPYGNADKDEVTGLPIYGLTDENKLKIQPQSVMMGTYIDGEGEELEETKGWVTAGNYVAVVIDKGKTVEEAQKNVYATVDEISISNMIYRTDIGSKVAKALPELKKHGFIEGNESINKESDSKEQKEEETDE